jgi:two-component system chemotaxis sensor kinase CheA
MAAIRETFFQECDEQLAALEAGLLALESGTADGETVNAVFRAVHSIKGGAGIFALEALVRFAHVFETTLDAMRAGRLDASAPVLALLLRAADALADLVRAAREGGAVDAQRTAALVSEFARLEGGADGPPDPDPAPPPARGFEIVFTPAATLYEKANEPGVLLRALQLLGEVAVELDASRLPDLASLDPAGAYLTWRIAVQSDGDEASLREVFEFVEDDGALEITDLSAPGLAPGDVITAPNGFTFEFFAPLPPDEPDATPDAPPEVGPEVPPPVRAEAKAEPARVEAAPATIRVDLDRVDRMIDLVGELVINEAMLNQRVMEAGINRASGVATALEALAHLTREIQDSVMAIRAQPVRAVFQRMPRLVREVAAQTGKPVRLVTEGEGTEVDKTVIERIADPLTHMIRNAIDHGLETPAARLAAGKPAEGTVRLSALHRSGRIVLEVADDGAGIDRPLVRRKAIDKGLIPADAALSDEEIDNLIFLPGFSTAATISDISGRGVGMDVVRQSVAALGGRISIASKPGQGSTFTLSLPLTLAVLDGMVVSAQRHTLIIPLGAIVETLKPRRQDVHPLDRDLRVLALRGGYVPIVDVGLALGYAEQVLAPEDSVALLVECEGGARAVLLVDEIHGQRQVVIKSLEANYRAVPGIAAATVMGDGRVALILDVDAVVLAMRAAARAEPALAAA